MRRCLAFACLASLSTFCLAAEVSFPSGKLKPSDADETIKGQLFLPEGADARPAIILLPACGGMKSHVTNDWPSHFLSLGYVVLTVDTLGSRGYFKGCASLRDRFAVQARDAYGALDALAKHPRVDAAKIAAMGFSMGGIALNEIVYAQPRRPDGQADFAALVSLYGRCRGMQPNAERRTPVLQVAAELDRQLMPSCATAAKNVPMEFVLLPGVHHAFDQADITQLRPDPTGNMMLYDAAATEKVKGLVSAFLKQHLPPAR